MASSRARRGVGAVLVVLLLGGAVVLNRTADRLPVRADDSTVADPGGVPGGRSDDEPGVAQSGLRSPYRPAPGLPATGPGLTEPGVLLVATPGADAVEVVERILLPEPSDEVTLEPPAVSAAGAPFEESTTSVEDLVVDADGAAVGSAPEEASDSTTLELGRDVQALELRYRLVGSTELSLPSSSGRALAVAAPVVAGLPDDLPVAVVTPGSTVRNLACAADEMPLTGCAAGLPPLLRVEGSLPLEAALVVVQFDVPDA